MDYSPISKSGVDTFRKCPQRTYLEHCVPDNRAPVNDFAAFGGEVHTLHQEMRRDDLTPEEMESKAKFIETGELLSWLDTLHNEEKELTSSADLDVYELKIAINEHGEDVWDDNDAIARGILDRLRIIGKRGIIDEYKSGKKHYDSPFERDLYAQLVISRFPEVNQVTFRRVLPRIKKLYVWDYQWGKSLTITYRNLKRQTSFEKDYLLKQINEIHKEIQDCNPRPELTNYCKFWYGSPCYYYNQCFGGEQ